MDGEHNTWARANLRKQRFCKEVIVWKHVSCPYILEFNGVFYHNGSPAIVTPWMPHGNLIEYLENHTDADRLRLVSFIVLPARSDSSPHTSVLFSF